ncbi:hypothetical protein [Lutibacter sp.]|uniref:hypothetical protein n=1 Tax=Lutibacter sp. TaxID=1925666 RepID=UPI0025C64DA4|nr:hypothetical protein [Lutibacter sp.]
MKRKKWYRVSYSVMKKKYISNDITLIQASEKIEAEMFLMQREPNAFMINIKPYNRK